MLLASTQLCFFLTFQFIIFLSLPQIFIVRPSLSLKMWYKDQVNLFGWSVPPLDLHSAATGQLWWDRHQVKDWNGLQLSAHLVHHTIPSQSRAGSQCPELIPAVNCIYRWTASRLKTLLCITVLESHSEWVQCQSNTKTTTFTVDFTYAPDVLFNFQEGALLSSSLNWRFKCHWLNVYFLDQATRSHQSAYKEHEFTLSNCV